MFDAGDVLDGKYLVNGICSDKGGMGVILFVTPVENDPGFPIVLKYCRDKGAEQLSRFRREVRLLASFQGNSKIVQIADQNLDHDPPYFVMRFYPDGDLTKHASSFHDSYELQEQRFLQMIDCLQELHARKVFHRDIKPENFLIYGNALVVSDLGLTTEVDSDTRFTSTSTAWGSYGYTPPEFSAGGFKHADAPGDVFMLGKTMYVLLTRRNPVYLVGDDMPPPVFHIIERCCNVSKGSRYQTLDELKQSVVAAYDVLLGRSGGLGNVRRLLPFIEESIERRHDGSEDVFDLIEQLSLLHSADQITLCRELSRPFFSAMSEEPMHACLPDFLSSYERLVDSQDYEWSYAETIASNLRCIFEGNSVPNRWKAQVLDLAIRAAHCKNRFAAMDTCIAMVLSVADESLGLEIAVIIEKNRHTFIASVAPGDCRSDSIRAALRQPKLE